MKIKTNVKAGDHCWNALSALLKNPGDGNQQRHFCQCCQTDPQCLR